MPIHEGPPISEVKPQRVVPSKQPGRPKPASKPRVTQRSLETDIGALLVTGNLMLAPITKEDMLDSLEVESLAKAIDQQAQRSARFRKMVTRALETTGAAGLLSVVVIIAGRRMARHGIIDRQWDEGLKAFLVVSHMDSDANPDDVAAALAAMMGSENAATESSNGTTPSDGMAAG